MGGDDESEINIYHVLERPGDDADYEDLDAELDAEEKAHAEDDQGENLYHVLEGPTLETEESEDTTKKCRWRVTLKVAIVNHVKIQTSVCK